MARNNLESSRGLSKSYRSKFYGTSPSGFKSIAKQGDFAPQQRLSPPALQQQQQRVHTPPTSAGHSPRTSPGLLAGHYAGCKFTEPPLPSALPPPPQHWMQSPHVVLRPFISKQEPEQLAHQLKILLKVQA